MLDKRDNVALALEDLRAGDEAQPGTLKVTIRQPIDFGHKFAVREIGELEDIIKHGDVIGRATGEIKAGEHVHVHNVESLRAKKR